MQPRALLPTVLLAAALLAGCAAQDAPAAEMPQAASAEEAAALFAQAAANMPDRFAAHLAVERADADAMSGEALVDKAAQTSYLRVRMSSDIADMMAAASPMGMMGAEADLSDIALYATPEGSVALLGERAIVSAESGAYDDTAREQEGFAALADPAALLAGMSEAGFEVTSVTPDTLRERPAMKVEARYAENGAQVPVRAWIFTEPARIGRLVTTAPATGGAVDPFAGATMTLDLLYDGEIDVEVPAGMTRALGLRFESSVPSMASAFGGARGSDRSSEGTDEVVWTFAADGGIPLAEVTLELDGAPLLALSALTVEQDGVTAAYTDADGDGLVSAGDTLRVTGAEQSQLALHDTVSGIRVVPGSGLLLAALALAGVALLARRR